MNREENGEVSMRKIEKEADAEGGEDNPTWCGVGADDTLSTTSSSASSQTPSKRSRKASVQTAEELTLAKRLDLMTEDQFEMFNIGEQIDEMNVYKRARRFTPNPDCLKSNDSC